MSGTGSGLKTILLVLANLLLVPMFDKAPGSLEHFFFGFEELENNLHPAIQRRLFLYLREKAENEGCHFFITTHSNVVIDMFTSDPDAQLLHTMHDGESATVTTVETSADEFSVLDDLGVRASDILQTNVIVWVEGPSDRIYFNKWIELWSDQALIEGIHYQCLPFGGDSSHHMSFDWAERIDDTVAAIKISRHAILLIDSDKRKESSSLKRNTQRLVTEVRSIDGYAWVTCGKEVENYIPTSVWPILLDVKTVDGPAQYSDALDFYAEQKGNKAAPRKVPLARDVVGRLTKESIKDTLDMAEKLDAVCEKIRTWNGIVESQDA